MKSEKGGMQSSSAHYLLFCPVCSIPAFKMLDYGTVKEYFHFTKTGYVIHSVAVKMRGTGKVAPREGCVD